MRIKEVYEHMIARLRSSYDLRESQQIASMLLQDKYGISNPDRMDTCEAVSHIEKDLAKLLKGIPIQHVTGLAHFYGRQWDVNPNVLIPRPETEELTYKIISDLKQSRKQMDLIDIGTGSGCISITLKKELPALRVFAMDSSQEAINMAKINARRHKAQIAFYCFDIMDRNYWGLMGRFDVIVSNPPYIAESERSMMSASVLDYEPSEALFAGEDPLCFYRSIVAFADVHLNNGGCIYVEINQYRAEETELVFQEYLYRTEIIRDMQGNDRMIKAYPTWEFKS